MSMYPSAQVSK